MTTDNDLQLFTIYSHPLDYPNHVVVRRSRITRKGIIQDADLWTKVETIEEARKTIPPGLYRSPRQQADDPVIVEIWL